MSKSTAVSKVVETALTTAADNAIALNDLAEFAGAGFENATVTSFAIPFLQLLQSGSPQCKRSDGAFIEGASEGMLLNTVSNEVIDVFKRPAKLIFVYHKEAKVEWRTRENGGGFVQEHPATYKPATTKDDKGRQILDNGNQLVDTTTFYVLRLTEDGIPIPMVVTFTSTQLRKARKLMTVLRTPLLYSGQLIGNPPMFLRAFEATTVAESNEKGSWFGWEFKETGLTDGSTFAFAKKFYKDVVGGNVKEATDSLRPEGAGVDNNGAGDAGAAAF